MQKLEKLHPLCLVLFFAVTLIVPLAFLNPYFSAASLLSAVIYAFVKNGKGAFKTLFFSLAVLAFTSSFNMLFAHFGETVLFTIKNVDFKLEPLFYGFNQGMVLASVLIWFTVLGKAFDSEKIIYIFRFSPKLALIFSMVLGFIPRFLKKHEDIQNARIGLNGGKRPERFKETIKFSIENFSALISYSLESSIITSNSMSARGYNPKAIRPSRFKLTAFDIIILTVFLIFTAFIFTQYFIGNISYVFYPVRYTDALSIPALAVFLLFELYPSISEATENVRWKLSSVKA